MTNQDLISQLKEIVTSSSIAIYADSAEPARIEEIAKAGFNVFAANKSVKDGIDFVKSHKLHVYKESANLISELRTYKYKEDRNDNVLEEPVKFRDHLMDCCRYGLYTQYKRLVQEVQTPNYYIPDLGHEQTRSYHL